MKHLKWFVLMVALVGGLYLFPQTASAKVYHYNPKSIRGTWYNNTNGKNYRQYYIKTRVTKYHVYVSDGPKGQTPDYRFHTKKHTYSFNHGKKSQRLHVYKVEQGFYEITAGKAKYLKFPSQKYHYKKIIKYWVFIGRPTYHKLRGKNYRVMEQFVHNASAPYQRWYSYQYPKIIKSPGTSYSNQRKL
ncbi:hypothetical protein ACFQ44_05475 [Levilactobacillus lanxiensis]|uniref:Surface layer protein A domain-containing protein n=1 Tax=Levilactobacillus lanxiensis TaxID=2799568 RepID=A0ABW4D0Q0_9LACO|nr:hypothetical protein [Levilactobacillus lanxiensis]